MKEEDTIPLGGFGEVTALNFTDIFKLKCWNYKTGGYIHLNVKERNAIMYNINVQIEVTQNTFCTCIYVATKIWIRVRSSISAQF